MEVVNMRDKVENEQSYIKKQEAILQETTHNQSPPPAAASSPPSATTSPTHEFSFTISLHPNPPPKTTQQYGYNYNHFNDNEYNKHKNPSLTPPPEPLTAIDLSPADDIFFHGQLLPLHLLSHLPISPRSSTNSMDSFTLPMKDVLKDHNNPIGNTSFHYHHRNTISNFNLPINNGNHIKPKSKSFSIFSRPKSKKEGDVHDQDQDQEKERNPNINSKKKLAQLIKRYMKMVRPLLSFQKSKRSSNDEFNRQPHSFSGNLRSGLPLRRGTEFSAPASMRTSPANSGILLASGTVSPAISTTSDSTMEELHAAIQAAIAHCKNSIAIKDKVQV